MSGRTGQASEAESLPLADASRRLRRKPGRPRKVERALAPQSEVLGLQERQGLPSPGVGYGTTIAPLRPRLVDVRGGAQYLGISVDVMRDLDQRGVLPRVRLPGAGGGELRRVLFDVRDLDELVDRCRERRDG